MPSWEERLYALPALPHSPYFSLKFMIYIILIPLQPGIILQGL